MGRRTHTEISFHTENRKEVKAKLNLWLQQHQTRTQNKQKNIVPYKLYRFHHPDYVVEKPKSDDSCVSDQQKKLLTHVYCSFEYSC